jgi:TolB-like protein
MKAKSSPRRNRSLAPRTVALACLGLAVACAYSTTSRTAKDIKSIYVPFFENKTSQPNLEISVTNQIIQNLISDNTLKVVSENSADAVLDGQIVEFKNEPFSFDPANLNAQEYHVVVRVVATLFNRRTNEPIWKDKSFEGVGSYFVEKVENGNTFDQAVNESVRQITDRILNLTTQDW